MTEKERQNTNGLFLDRDGVINKRLPGAYVRSWKEFQFLEGVLESLEVFNRYFDHIFIVTNQQGIGKGLMTIEDLEKIHTRMMEEIEAAGGRVDRIFFCPDLATKKPNCRKPSPEMALQAKFYFTQLEFSSCVMIGDSLSDMQFGEGLGMAKVMIQTNREEEEKVRRNSKVSVDYFYSSLRQFARDLEEGRVNLPDLQK